MLCGKKVLTAGERRMLCGTPPLGGVRQQTAAQSTCLCSGGGAKNANEFLGMLHKSACAAGAKYAKKRGIFHFF